MELGLCGMSLGLKKNLSQTTFSPIIICLCPAVRSPTPSGFGPSCQPFSSPHYPPPQVFEMLNGRPPFSNFENQYATMMHVAGLKSTEDFIPDGVDKLSKAFLRRCLQVHHLRPPPLKSPLLLYLLQVEPDNRDTTPDLLQSEWFLQHPEDLVSQASVASTCLVPLTQTASPFVLSGSMQAAPSTGKPSSQSSASSFRGASGSSRAHQESAEGSSGGARASKQQGFETLPRTSLDSDVDSVKISHSDSDESEIEDDVKDFNPMHSYTGDY